VELVVLSISFKSILSEALEKIIYCNFLFISFDTNIERF
jgi:hypothetical protein